MTTLGARLVHVAPGEVDLAFAARPDLVQQNGFVHAGAIAGADETLVATMQSTIIVLPNRS